MTVIQLDVITPHAEIPPEVMPTPAHKVGRLLITILAFDVPVERHSDFSTVLARDSREIPLHQGVALCDFGLLEDQSIEADALFDI